MKKITGFYPRVQVDPSGCAAVDQAGAVLLTDTVRTSGLDVGLSASLAGWRKPTATHDPAKIIIDLAVSLALGGDCLADIAVLRAKPGLFSPVASDATASRIIDVLAGDPSAAPAAERRRSRAGAGSGVAAGRRPSARARH